MQTQVAIVGAGAAGIAAGRALASRGVRALLLEARHRTGGRAWTDTSAFGLPVDMGCAWLHSADVNPWTHYARERGYSVIERSPVWRRRIGREEPTQEYAAAWGAAFGRNERLIEEAAAAGRDVAVSELVPNDAFRPMFDCVMNWLMGVDTQSMSSIDYNRYSDSEVNWAVREGLGAVVAHAATELDVRLDTPVTAIDYRGRVPLLVTARGDIEAQAVIVTAPVAVLAAGLIRFIPSLPTHLAEALDGIALGVDEKVFFELEAGALPYVGSLHFVGTDESMRTASYQVRPAGHDLLLAFFGGSFARELERTGTLVSFAREELTHIFGSDFTKRIRRIAHSSWVSDPFAHGSYSAALPGKAHMRPRLDEALNERILFAGEAGSIDAFGTIHGAWHTGVVAAERALKLLD